MNTNAAAPRFVGEYPSTLSERRARLLDFADFLDNLKLRKFNHGKWCRPDHTCKTEACGAGWAAICYSKNTQEIMDLIYKKQRLEAERTELSRKLDKLVYGTEAYQALDKQRKEKLREINKITVSTDDIHWSHTGRRVLGLDYDTSQPLFIPGSGFWDKQHDRNASKRKSGDTDISARQFALAIRFLAHTPNCNFVNLKTNKSLDIDEEASFNPKAYKQYIKDHPLPSEDTPTLTAP